MDMHTFRNCKLLTFDCIAGSCLTWTWLLSGQTRSKTISQHLLKVFASKQKMNSTEMSSRTALHWWSHKKGRNKQLPGRRLTGFEAAAGSMIQHWVQKFCQLWAKYLFDLSRCTRMTLNSAQHCAFSSLAVRPYPRLARCIKSKET